MESPQPLALAFRAAVHLVPMQPDFRTFLWVVTCDDVKSVPMSRASVIADLKCLRDLLTWAAGDVATLMQVVQTQPQTRASYDLVHHLVDVIGVVPTEDVVEAAVATAGLEIVGYLLSKMQTPFTRAACVDIAIGNLVCAARRGGFFSGTFSMSYSILATLCACEAVWTYVDPLRMVLLAVRSRNQRVMRSVFELVEKRGHAIPDDAKAIFHATSALREAVFAFEQKFADVTVLPASCRAIPVDEEG